MSKDILPEPRSWDEGDEAVVRLRAGLRRAREVLDGAREDMLKVTDPWPEPERDVEEETPAQP